jgi:Uma2 family endonuclease
MSAVLEHRSESSEQDQPLSKRWTRSEFLRMGEVGLLKPDARVELVEGEILEMSPMNRPHRVAVVKAEGALQRAFGEGYYVTGQLPLAIGEATELYPDVAVFEGDVDDSPEAPTGAVLVLEISDSTLRYDRGRKLPLYAAAGVPEYWILDVNSRTLEIYQDPMPSTTRRGRFTYRVVSRHADTDCVIPLFAPERVVPVSDLLAKEKKD